MHSGRPPRRGPGHAYRLFPGKPALFYGLLEADSPWEAVAHTVHLLTRPLAESPPGLETPTDEVVDEVVAAWLRAPTRPDRAKHCSPRSAAP